MLTETTKDAPGNHSQGTAVFVYGHGPENPFFKEAQALKANSGGCLLVLNAPPSRGQRLSLMAGAKQTPVEADIVKTRALGARRFEVEVSFPVAHPDFLAGASI